MLCKESKKKCLSYNTQGNDGKSRVDGKSHTHVTPILFSGGMPAVGGGEQGCESLRGMGSGILLVMYYTPRALGKGVGGVQLGSMPT